MLTCLLSTHHFSTIVLFAFFNGSSTTNPRIGTVPSRIFAAAAACVVVCMGFEGVEWGPSKRARQMTEREWTRSFNERASERPGPLDFRQQLVAAMLATLPDRTRHHHRHCRRRRRRHRPGLLLHRGHCCDFVAAAAAAAVAVDFWAAADDD